MRVVDIRDVGLESVMEKCPVCWKPVVVSSVRRIVFPHRDGIGEPCTMAGMVLPPSIWDEEGKTA